jgi:K+-sensing histidine kinase KdpD
MAAFRGDFMWMLRGIVSLAVTVAIVAAITALLWYSRVSGVGPHHPVFAYLLPIALVAVVFGSAPGVWSAAIAIACAAYFLYDPVYSFHVANRLEFGDLICFAMLALITVKCTVELSRPAERLPAGRPRYERP